MFYNPEFYNINRPGKNQGITLMEVVVASAIIVILSLIGLGFIRRYQPNIKLFTETKKLRSNINAAREKTIHEQKPYGIKIYQDEKKYELILISAPSEPIEIHEFESGVFISNISDFTDDIIAFNTAGAARESGSIILKNSEGEQKTLTVNPSGYVQNE